MSRISRKSVLLFAAGAVVLATLGVATGRANVAVTPAEKRVALLERKIEALEQRLKAIETALEEVTTPGVRPVMRLRPPDPMDIPFRPTVYANGWRCGETNGLPHCAGPIVHRSR
jgi:hypothetical protein